MPALLRRITVSLSTRLVSSTIKIKQRPTKVIAPEHFNRLPYDLEREILELTTYCYPEVAPKLTQVCRRAQIWIEAILYRTIVLDYPPMTTDLFIRTIESRPASFFATHVKNLYITNFVPYEQAQRLLAVCTDLTSLACWTSAGGPHTNLPLIVKSDSASFHKLRRLSISLNALAFPCLSSQESFLRQLTHLEVVNPPMASAEEWKTFLTLPSLTHLALGNLYAPAHGDILPALDFLLEESTALRVLVLLSTNQPFLRLLQEDCLLQDPRVITLESFHRGMDVFEFWNSVRRHERDPWTLPEEMIMTRKANKRLL